MFDNLSPQEFDAFVAFGRERILGNEPVGSLEELCSKWRDKHPTAPVASDDATLVNEAIEDYRQGDRGRSAEEHLRELKDHVLGRDP